MHEWVADRAAAVVVPFPCLRTTTTTSKVSHGTSDSACRDDPKRSVEEYKKMVKSGYPNISW